jgi:hypothetical protein
MIPIVISSTPAAMRQFGSFRKTDDVGELVTVRHNWHQNRQGERHTDEYADTRILYFQHGAADKNRVQREKKSRQKG